MLLFLARQRGRPAVFLTKRLRIRPTAHDRVMHAEARRPPHYPRLARRAVRQFTPVAGDVEQSVASPHDDEYERHVTNGGKMTARYCMGMALIAAVPCAAEARPVETAVLINDPNFVPELTVVQEVNDFGQLHYARIIEEDMHLEAWLKGRCGLNWRIQSAALRSPPICNGDLSGEANQVIEVCPSSGDEMDDDDESPGWTMDFEVNQDNMTFGPREAHLEQVPTAWLTRRLARIGDELITELAELSGNSPQFVRSLDLRIPVDLGVTFWMTCRRFAGNNDHATKTHTRDFPLYVTYRGASADGLPFEIDPEPPEQPRQPIPFGELTDRIHIEQAYLMILPDDTPDTCGMFLSGTFRTSGPTVVTYQIVDALGARSAQHEVTVDQSGVAFVSHELDFAEGTGATIGFTAADDGDTDPQDGIAFGTSLLDVPSDNLRGYYRIETLSPHRSSSNIVSYNLGDCTAEQGPRTPVFDAVVLGDPERIRELFREARSEEGYQPTGAD